MYAIIEDSGTQIKVAEGDVVDVDPRELAENAKSVTFDKVLLIGDAEAAGDRKVGTPYVQGASVTGEIVKQYRDRKVDVIKYKRRKGFFRKNGHRQPFLQVKITGITG